MELARGDLVLAGTIAELSFVPDGAAAVLSVEVELGDDPQP